MNSHSARSTPSAAEQAQPEGSDTLRLLPVVVPVTAAGIAVLGAAAWSLLTSTPSLGSFAGLLALLVASVVVEAYPVPVEGVPAGSVSLGAVFIVGTAVVYGWAPAVVIGFATRALVDILDRRPPIRFLYNAGVYALGAAGAGVAAWRFDGSEVADVFLAVSGGSRNVLRNEHRARRARHLRLGQGALLRAAPPVGLLDFRPVFDHGLGEPHARRALGALAASLGRAHRPAGRRRPVPELGPRISGGNAARAHRSPDGARKPPPLPRAAAARASTRRRSDGTPVTHLPHRHRRFQARSTTVTAIPSGDRVLAQVASRLRQGGEAFRLGGDEFALLLPGRTGEETFRSRTPCSTGSRHRRASTAARSTSRPASPPIRSTALDRSELVRVADNALYWSKEHGRGRAHVYRPDVDELAELRWLGEGRDRAACLRAAASLAHAVDARDAYTGSHSSVVGELAARVAISDGPRARGDRAAPARGQPARRRQARHPRGDPAQARAR